eukprot:COSAG02_NODE_731_length_17977_cov_21.672838_13_plen_83_part_00
MIVAFAHKVVVRGDKWSERRLGEESYAATRRQVSTTALSHTNISTFHIFESYAHLGSWILLKGIFMYTFSDDVALLLSLAPC